MAQQQYSLDEGNVLQERFDTIKVRKMQECCLLMTLYGIIENLQVC